MLIIAELILTVASCLTVLEGDANVSRLELTAGDFASEVSDSLVEEYLEESDQISDIDECLETLAYDYSAFACENGLIGEEEYADILNSLDGLGGVSDSGFTVADPIAINETIGHADILIDNDLSPIFRGGESLRDYEVSYGDTSGSQKTSLPTSYLTQEEVEAAYGSPTLALNSQISWTEFFIGFEVSSSFCVGAYNALLEFWMTDAIDIHDVLEFIIDAVLAYEGVEAIVSAVADPLSQILSDFFANLMKKASKLWTLLKPVVIICAVAAAVFLSLCFYYGSQGYGFRIGFLFRWAFIEFVCEAID